MKSEKFNRTRDFEERVHNLLDQIAKTNQAYGAACVRFFGVTTSQGGTLLAFTPDKTMSMKDLSLAVGVDSSTMTRMVDQLVDKGLVVRKTDEKDRRLVRIGLTPAGRKLHRELNGALAGFYKDSLDEIPDQERVVIIQSLDRLNRAIAKGLENCCQKYCNR